MMMKNNLLLAALLASAVALVPAQPASADEVSGSINNVKLALTLTTLVPGTFERDENGKFIKDEETNQKIPTEENSWEITKGEKVTAFQEASVKAQRTKYGNKELLLDLLEADILPDTSIQGWAVKCIQIAASGSPVFCLVKKDGPFVNLSGVFGLDSFSDDIEVPNISYTTISQLVTTTVVGEAEPVEKVKVQLQTEVMTGFVIDVEGLGGKLYGLASATQKLALSKAGQNVFVLKLSMPVMVGNFVTPDGEAFAKGSIQLSPGVVVNDLTPILGEP